MKIKGVCLHHDGGMVGAAVPDDVWRRRLTKLKKAGCNAIRISHNPGSEAFLNLCDEMGFLVQDEFFDEWDNPKDKRKNMNEQSVDYVTRGYTEHFQEWAEKDLKNTILAHRNHPSIIQWSIGNEIEWTYPRNTDATGFFNNMGWQGNYFFSEPPFTPEQIKEQLKTLPKEKYDIGKTAQKLAKWTKELDTTRYVTANCILPSASHLSGYTDALDVVGYSYRRVIYDYGHKNYPNEVIMGTENLPQWHEWKAVMERPFISGLFLWTGIDYMGESNGGWPKKGTNSGLLNSEVLKKLRTI
ncbi:glycoside hydrolase family 2 TIM barrel-domain containing protein [Zobellia nedashkovskayae]